MFDKEMVLESLRNISNALKMIQERTAVIVTIKENIPPMIPVIAQMTSDIQ